MTPGQAQSLRDDLDPRIGDSSDAGAISGGAQLPLLDPQAIQRLRELDPSGAHAMLERVFQAYHASLERLLADLAGGADPAVVADAALLDRIGRAAHTLKSSSAAVGALAFAARCAEIEQLVRVEHGGPPAQMLQALVHEGRRVQAAVATMLRR